MTHDDVRSAYVRWRDRLEGDENTCPWPGPRPLRESDGLDMLVGRERDRRLFNHEVQNHRLILLAGESGVGKSSLLDAGLVPDLREVGYTVAVCRDWGDDSAGDAADDETFLAHAVFKHLKHLKPKDLAELTNDRTLFQQLNERFGPRLVIIFDQFEELLRYNRDRKTEISRILLDIHQNLSIRVVLSFRSEYLHELKDIESGATAFGLSSYLLNPVEDRFAAAVIRNTRKVGPTARDDERIDSKMDQAVEDELVRSWTAARHDPRPELAVRVGMLHLQAMLYALHDRASRTSGGRIDASVLARLRADAGRGATDSQLFAYGLQEAVNVKLHRCENAAWRLGMDRFLVRGTATLLGKTVSHLSSGGYKLVREAHNLAILVLEKEFDLLLGALDLDPQALRSSPKPLSRMLFVLSDEALRERDEGHSSAEAGGDGRDDQGSSLSRRRRELAAAADVGQGPGEFSWLELLDADAGAGHPNNPAAGPMRGLSPAAVLIEELRRFAWALVWLKEGSLVRITRHGPSSLVSLIHDGFGEALLAWQRAYEDRDRVWALYALTAPSGMSHVWDDDETIRWFEPDGRTEVGIPDELCGKPGEPRIFGNLCFKGNAIIRARFENTVFVNCDFRGTLFLRNEFSGVTFVNCQLDGALFSDCTVIGRPDPAGDAPPGSDANDLVPENPTFNVAGAGFLAGAFRHYRAERDETTAAHLVSLAAGQPAEANDRAMIESTHDLPWSPARGGLLVYGGRVSALTFRGTTFKPGATVAFRGVTGSGLDLAELSDASLEFHRCLLRHVAMTAGARDTTPDSSTVTRLNVEIDHSILAQCSFGSRFEGSVRAVKSRIVQPWNDSPKLATNSDEPVNVIKQIGPDDDVLFNDGLRQVVSRSDYRRT